LGKTTSIAVLIRELKRESSKWVKEQPEGTAAFYWQAGYAAFSISPAHVDILKHYIRNQEEHHMKETFQDELRRICKKCGVELDERYAWD
jgi:REP element-mobilizing transposase RayT